ncbi:hypothetical protein CDAR_585841 [Caerostris darwini]|uniref:Uncharacterized protein n=1 Tax=Caerostris darwini TaxID=1538125 RepID=A0AAV4TMP4_9ARAC|nr:hypothetical protein CDAR_585841 [Caerostris darwini]
MRRRIKSSNDCSLGGYQRIKEQQQEKKKKNKRKLNYNTSHANLSPKTIPLLTESNKTKIQFSFSDFSKHKREGFRNSRCFEISTKIVGIAPCHSLLNFATRLHEKEYTQANLTQCWLGSIYSAISVSPKNQQMQIAR